MQKHILPFLYDEDCRHIEKFISESITKVAEYYVIERKNLYIAFDNASNNKAAIGKLKADLSPLLPKIFHVKCACHIYNLLVKEGLEFFEFYIEKVQLAISFMQGNNRRKRMREFKVKCEQNGLRPILMPEECDTKWNVTYLKTCLAYKVPITMTFNQYYDFFSRVYAT